MVIAPRPPRMDPRKKGSEILMISIMSQPTEQHRDKGTHTYTKRNNVSRNE